MRIIFVLDADFRLSCLLVRTKKKNYVQKSWFGRKGVGGSLHET